MRHLRKVLSSVLALSMLLSLAACNGGGAAGSAAPSDGGASAGGTAPKKDVITLAFEDDIESLDCYAESGGNLAGVVYDMIYEGLFGQDKDGNYIPVLVESYEQTDDLTWKMKLKEGVLFHNGEELTAEDVKASFEYGLEVHPAQNHKKTVEVVDKYNLILRTPEPDPFLIESDLALKWNLITPKSAIESGNDLSKNPIGTGPYRFSDRATAEYLRLVKFDEYRDDPKLNDRIGEVMIKMIPEPSARTIALQNGEVDLVKSVETMDVDRLAEDPNTQVLETEGTSYYNITINTAKAPLDNINVRKAIAYAVNPENAMLAAINGQGQVSRGIVRPDQVGYSDEYQPVYDPEQAKQFLADAGFEPGELTVDLMAYNAIMSRCAESLQADLQEIGINATISNVEQAVMMKKAASGEFDAIVMGNANSDRVHYLLDALFHSKNTTSSNRCKLNDPETDALLDTVGSAVDQESVIPEYQELVERIQSQYAVVPMFLNKTYTAYRTGMTNVYRNRSGKLFVGEIRFE